MAHSKATTAQFIEPANDSKLVLANADGNFKVIWRDDEAAANHWGGADDQRWYDDSDSDPMALHEHLKYAHAVYSVAFEPTKVFA